MKSNALLTDKYQLTMAKAYWDQGEEQKEACFSQFFRSNPFDGGYAVASGIADVKRYIDNFEFTSDDIKYLQSLRGPNNQPLFPKGFLNYLEDMELDIDIKAVDEGTIVFPYEPIMQVTGPIAQCQILETPLLNMVNFQTLVATKTSRMKNVAGDRKVLEFGLRRAQGPNGALSASRASYVGGADATSNMLAGKYFDIPTKGTHSHSWVMFHADEYESFKNYSESFPRNCVLLVDTYDTMQGIEKAIDIAKDLEERDSNLKGVRLDSGDLCELSKKARERLDEAGLEDVMIIASSDLDEYKIKEMQENGGEIDAYGIGTKLATCYEEPALGGVYKLTAVKEKSDKDIIESEWNDRIKVSENSVKTTIPGVLNVKRYYDVEEAEEEDQDDDFTAIGDIIYDESEKSTDRGVDKDLLYEDGHDHADQSEVLLTEIVEDGEIVEDVLGPEQARNNFIKQKDLFGDDLFEIDRPSKYKPKIEKNLFDRRERLIDDKSTSD